jgi:hypothetical protein
MKAPVAFWLAAAVMAGSVGSRAQQPETGIRIPSDPMPVAIQKPEEIHFKQRTFTFVRIRYSGVQSRRSWATDYPDADHNFAAHLEKLEV